MGHVDEAGVGGLADQRVATGKVDVVGDKHQVARRERGGEPAGGVGQQHGAAAEAREETDAEDDALGQQREEEAEAFAFCRDRVLTHRAILAAIWGGNAVEQPEHLWTLVAQLRKKIEPDPSRTRLLLTEGGGYRLDAQTGQDASISIG